MLTAVFEELLLFRFGNAGRSMFFLDATVVRPVVALVVVAFVATIFRRPRGGGRSDLAFRTLLALGPSEESEADATVVYEAAPPGLT